MGTKYFHLLTNHSIINKWEKACHHFIKSGNCIAFWTAIIQDHHLSRQPCYSQIWSWVPNSLVGSICTHQRWRDHQGQGCVSYPLKAFWGLRKAKHLDIWYSTALRMFPKCNWSITPVGFGGSVGPKSDDSITHRFRYPCSSRKRSPTDILDIQYLADTLQKYFHPCVQKIS